MPIPSEDESVRSSTRCAPMDGPAGNEPIIVLHTVPKVTAYWQKSELQLTMENHDTMVTMYPPSYTTINQRLVVLKMEQFQAEQGAVYAIRKGVIDVVCSVQRGSNQGSLGKASVRRGFVISSDLLTNILHDISFRNN